MQTLKSPLKPVSHNLVVSLVLLYFILLPVFLFFGDRGWWDGDAIAQLEGILNFQYRGTTGVYRYYWQPLAYEINLFVIRLTNNPRLLYYLPQIFGAANICILLGALSKFSQRKLPMLLNFCLLLLLPEIFFSGLYYNSTVFAMLPMSIAILFIFWQNNTDNLINRDPSSTLSWDDIRYLVIGITAAIACFFRFDFSLCLPLLGYLLLTRENNKTRAILLFSSSVIAIFILFFIIGIFSPQMILKILREHSDVVGEWTYITPVFKAKVIFTTMNVTVWVIFLGYLLYFLQQKILKREWRSLLIIFPSAILLYPIPKITSPKYLMPAIIFMPFIFANMLLDLNKRLTNKNFQRLSYFVIAGTVLLQILSIQPAKAFPFIQLTPSPYSQETHDGPRTVGAYLQGYNRVRMIPNEPKAGEGIDVLQKASKLIDSANVPSVVLLKKGTSMADNRNWGWLSFYLQLEGYKIEDFSDNKIILTKNNKQASIERIDENSFLQRQKTDKNILIQRPNFLLLQ